MIKGNVIGQVWSTKRIDSLPSGALLEIRTEKDESLIAFDPLGCAVGEEVLIVQGSVATGYFTESKVTVDALIIGSIDQNS